MQFKKVQHIAHVQSLPYLPDELWLKIFDNLGTAPKVRLSIVCKQWRDLIRNSWTDIIINIRYSTCDKILEAIVVTSDDEWDKN